MNEKEKEIFNEIKKKYMKSEEFEGEGFKHKSLRDKDIDFLIEICEKKDDAK